MLKRLHILVRNMLRKCSGQSWYRVSAIGEGKIDIKTKVKPLRDLTLRHNNRILFYPTTVTKDDFDSYILSHLLSVLVLHLFGFCFNYPRTRGY